MAFERFKGQAQDAAGRVQSTVGDAIGDEGLQTGGLARQVEGQAREMYATAKDSLKEAGGHVSDLASDAYDNRGAYAERGVNAVTAAARDNPLTALMLAGAVGFLAALLTRRS